MAADIRRRAEREASAVRREAAEWASETRREAERHRARVLADLEHAAQAVTPEPDRPEPAPEPEAQVEPRPEPEPEPEIEYQVEPQIEAAPLASLIDLRAAAEARGAPMGSEARPAMGGTYVVGQRPAPVETSLESKVHDVVRLAVRRTFNRQFP